MWSLGDLDSLAGAVRVARALLRMTFCTSTMCCHTQDADTVQLPRGAILCVVGSAALQPRDSRHSALREWGGSGVWPSGTGSTWQDPSAPLCVHVAHPPHCSALP